MPDHHAVEMKHRAKGQFESWAESYDRSLLNYLMFHPAYTTCMEEIAQWYALRRRPFRVLDIGCGTGTLSGWLARSPWPLTTVGMDYAEGMCRQAARKAAAAQLDHRASFTTGDSEHLPFADGSFDIVTCSNSFHHYPRQGDVVREMRRVLRPEGRLILLDGFRDNIVGWITFDVIVGRVEGHIHHATWSEVHQHFKAAGFDSVRRRKVNVWFPLLATIGDVA